jgi:hypothetical protein
MTAFATGRDLEIHGTNGVLRAGHAVLEQTGSDIVIVGNDGKPSRLSTSQVGGGYEGHGGGDQGLVDAIYEAFSGSGEGKMTTSLSLSIESHVVGFAAEASRTQRRIVNLQDFRASAPRGSLL